MFRCMYRRSRSTGCLFLTGCLYIVTSIWILSRLDDTRGSIERISYFSRVHDPFGSRLHHRVAKFGIETTDVTETSYSNTQHQHELVGDQCFRPEEIDNNGIKMEDVWDAVSIGYPNLVLSVTGWVDTIRVTSWSVKPLHVIVVPHSHQDPGWLRTADNYYNIFTKRTLDLLVARLDDNPSWTFIWSEIVFLSRWWQTATRYQQETMKRLVTRGQLELVTGGWVMPDEATTPFSALIDQLIEGHRWINATFNITIRTGWAIDPFGHSSTMPYLLRRAGVRDMVIQRTHFAVKRQFARDKNLEFVWKQSWGKYGDGIFCHMMPFLLYSIPYSCGPDRHVCCKFDFHKKNCFKGTKHVPVLAVTDDNVATLSQELWEQLQKKSELYRSNVVLLPHGDDFRYDTAEEWHSQFTNMERIMKYINQRKDMNTRIEFGTPADYFRALRADVPEVPIEDRFPALFGDFLTYSDRGNQYWSGFYTTRPFLKALIRKLQYNIRAAESMFMFSRPKGPLRGTIYDKLESVRQGLAVHLHHDAITGTSRGHVIRDYITKIQSSLKTARDIYVTSLLNFLTSQCSQYYRQDEYVQIGLGKNADNQDEDDVIHISPNPKTILMISNMLGETRREVVHVRTDRRVVTVTDSNQTKVLYQMSPAWNKNGSIDSHSFILSIEVTIDPFTIKPYFIVPSSDIMKEPMVTVEYYKWKKRNPHTDGMFEENFPDSDVVKLSNRELTATVTIADGLLKSVYYHSQRQLYKSDTYFVTYSTGRNSHPFSDKSGAYVFLPDGVAKEFAEEPEEVVVIRGPLYSQIRTSYPSVLHIVTVFNTTGVFSRGIHVENVVNLEDSKWNNHELVMRVESDIHNDQHTFCTDVNGFQLQRRKTRAKMILQGNFHPVTTMALTENMTTRMTLLTTGTHAMASLVSGWLEAVLDRRLIQDDWRGLNENITDNVPVKSTFFLVFEERKMNSKLNDQNDICLPSLLSDTLSEQLNNPLTFTTLIYSSATEICAQTITLGSGLPCGYRIVNFRSIHGQAGTREALVSIHRRGIDCDFRTMNNCVYKDIWRFQDWTSPSVIDVRETSLTGTEVKQILDPSDPILIQPMEIKTFKIAFR